MDHSTPWQTFLAIFKNNTEAMLLIVGLGVFAGIASLTFLVTNGFMLGVIAFLFISKGSALVFFSGIVPHGIIEIPCMLFSAAIGFRIGRTVILKIFPFVAGLIAFISVSIVLSLLFYSGIIPHGIENIYNIFSAIIGIIIGFEIGKMATSKVSWGSVSLTHEISEGIKFAITIIIPLLLVAALIETYITPLFIALAQFATGS
jgi:uncharacterized membrane protein SpoIIM required for sporulation